MIFQLAVADLPPFKNQALALSQLIKEVRFDVVPIGAAQSKIFDPVLGPFIALIGHEFPIPLFGLSTIVEHLHRKFPDKEYLPADPIARSRSRATAQIIEQRLSYYLIAQIAWEKHGRSRGEGAADSGAIILETPPPLESIDKHHAQVRTRFMAGMRPSLADCHMAALWWTAEDANLDHELKAMPALSEWYSKNCVGDPFGRG